MLWSDEAAPTSVEYALLIGGIAVVIVASVGTLGTTVAGLFSSAAALWP
jgi:Flp pilus assembly pilin Flp